MATFISNIRFTEKGIKDIKATRNRAESFRAAAEKMGGAVKQIYWTFGPFDGLLIFEAPDDTTATAMMLHLGSLGDVLPQTARAYGTEEMEQVLGKL